MQMLREQDFFKYIDDYLVHHNDINLIIAGCTCSGKTTLTKKIKDKYKDVSEIPQDSYFKDLEQIPNSHIGKLYDSPNACLINEYQKDAMDFCSGKTIKIPKYEVVINKQIERYAYERKKSKINIFEGLHTISILQEISPSIKVFVDTPRHICLERRIKRDCAKYPVDGEFVARFWSENLWPLTELYVLPQKKQADIIIEWEEER